MAKFPPAMGGLPKSKILFLSVLLLLLLTSLSGRAQTNPAGKLARCSWDPPTYGTPVDHYVLQVVKLGGSDPDTTLYDEIEVTFKDVWVVYGNTYKARVAGVDSLDRQGPWSLWTPVYGPEWTMGDEGTAQQ